MPRTLIDKVLGPAVILSRWSADYWRLNGRRLYVFCRVRGDPKGHLVSIVIWRLAIVLGWRRIIVQQQRRTS